MKRIKLFGGPHHGRGLDINPDRIEVRTVNYIPPKIEAWDPQEPREYLSHEINFDTTTYVRHKIQGYARTFEIWAPSEWLVDDVLSELIRRAHQ